MRVALIAIALLSFSACSAPLARIAAIQSAEGDVALGFCEPVRWGTFVVIAVTGEPVWYARLGLLMDDSAELRASDDVLYGDILVGDARSRLLARGDFSDAMRSTSRIVVACCPPAQTDANLEFSLTLDYIRQSEAVLDRVRAADLIQRCETPEVSLSPMRDIRVR
ncbi:MAG: hypothetical protein K2X34_01800 [Hyphomonadaceae bacterium]|nr:hypothetical protein [Hyphomonadaceae bacterium]